MTLRDFKHLFVHEWSAWKSKKQQKFKTTKQDLLERYCTYEHCTAIDKKVTYKEDVWK